MKGLIIIGYQGIGKSSINSYNNTFIDFESSLFKIDGDRIDNWYVIYCRQAVAMAKQGHIVLVSSHKCVRDELSTYDQINFSIATIAPSMRLKSKWISKLHSRYINDRSDKNYAAWKNAEECYDSNIQDIANSTCFSHIFINSMDYDLRKIIMDLYDILCCKTCRYAHYEKRQYSDDD